VEQPILYGRGREDAEIVYVVKSALESRCEYFREYLRGSQFSIGSQIPFHGNDVDVFKMIIEWIYSMNIERLNGMISTLLHDLESLYVAAEMYDITDLRDSIQRYLSHLVNLQNFGDIYQIAKRIDCDSLKTFVFQAWISSPDTFNENDDQIEALVSSRYNEDEDVISNMEDDEDEGTEEADKDVEEEAKMYGIAREIVKASDWQGDKESKFGVIKCLTELLCRDKEEVMSENYDSST
jgi:hypothetical protein